MFHIYFTSVYMWNFRKKILTTANFIFFHVWPHRRGQGEGKILITVMLIYRHWVITQELDVDLFSILVYPLRSKGKDGHSAAAQIVSGWITPLLVRLHSRAYTIWINNCPISEVCHIHCLIVILFFFLWSLIVCVWWVHGHLCCYVLFYWLWCSQW